MACLPCLHLALQAVGSPTVRHKAVEGAFSSDWNLSLQRVLDLILADRGPKTFAIVQILEAKLLHLHMQLRTTTGLGSYFQGCVIIPCQLLRSSRLALVWFGSRRFTWNVIS